ncbi:MAG: hypothetical protein JWP55_724 [Mycobacterium sp.]|nr:hypothetical protein [Mycobacterium sp.]
MVRVWLVATVVALALMGCQHAKEARADDVEFHMNEAFALAGGQDVIVGEKLRIRFDEVLEDSRCPAQVECVWSGQARIAFVVQAGESAPKTVAFNTHPAPGQNVQTAEVGEYVIKLVSLEPYPQTPEDVIPLEQYRATLEVRKSAP